MLSTKISRLSKTKLGLHYYKRFFGFSWDCLQPRGLIDRARLPAHVLIYCTPSSSLKSVHLSYKIVALLDEHLILLNTST